MWRCFFKIVLVIDQFDNSNNGTTITARRFAEQLRRRGHTVKVLAAGTAEKDKITVPKHCIPLFQGLIESQGMCFAEPVEEAFEGQTLYISICHFALDERSLFQAGDAQSLADRIDYWIEHPEEKAELAQKYIASGNSMRVEHSVVLAEQMYRDAIDHWKENGCRQIEKKHQKRKHI